MTCGAHQLALDHDLASLCKARERELEGFGRKVVGQAAAQRARRNPGADRLGGVPGGERGERALLRRDERVGREPEAAPGARRAAGRLERGERRLEHVAAQAGLREQPLSRHAREPRARDPHRDIGLRIAAGESLELVQELRIAAPPVRRRDVEHHTAPERRSRSLAAREAAHDEAIARQNRERLALDVDAREAALAGHELVRADRREPRASLAGGGEQLDRDGALRARRAREPDERDVERVRRRERPRRGDDLPARHVGELDTLEIQRAARARLAALLLLGMTLHAAHARAQAGRKDLDGVADGERAPEQRSGHDGAEALRGEGAVDREPRRPAARRARRCARGDLEQRVAQRVEPRARLRRDGHDRRVREGAVRPTAIGPPLRRAPRAPAPRCPSS